MSPEILFRALADETRLRCVALIYQADELCVCELAYTLGLVQPKVSRHLGILKTANVLQDRRNGVWVYYHLHSDLPPWTRQVIAATVNGVNGQDPFAQDKKMLRTIVREADGTPRCA